MKYLYPFTLSLFLLLSASHPSLAVGKVIINEILYDPIGSDLGYEWIELYNLSNEEINLNGWTIFIAGTSFQKALEVTGTISPHGFFTICEQNVEGCSLNVAKIAMQNGGNATDGIQIRDFENTVIDTVLYDSPNINSLMDDNGKIAADGETAPKTKSGESLGRNSFMDTNNSQNDFFIYTQPTLGKINIDIKKEDKLEKTGENPLFYAFGLLFFILIKHSVTLLKYHNFSTNKNGNPKT